MSKKNVLHILRTYSLHGGEKQLSKVLPKNKFFNNFFLDVYNDKVIKSFYIKKKIPYLYLNNFYIRPKNILIEIFFSFFLMFYNFKKISKILKIKKIDIVLCHGIQSAILVQLIMFFYNKKINFYYMHRILKYNRSYDFISKIIYARFRLVLCNSEAVKKSLYAFCDKSKLKVVYNAVNTYNKLKFKKGEKIILSIARLEKRKNLLFLIKAFSIFQKKKLKYNLFIIGDGPEKNNLINYINRNKIKNIKFFGYKKNIKQYLNKCSIFVHTSLFEGMSNAVLEAMALGRPSIVLNSPGVSELHVHAKTGFVSNRNIKKFANYMEKLSDNFQLQKIFFKNSRERVENKYSIDKTLKSYNKYLK